MAVCGKLLVILAVLTSVKVMLAKRPNSPRQLFICENDTGNFSECENYPGIIKILNVEFPQENEHECHNKPGQNKSKCFAKVDDELSLTSILGQKCDGKRTCKVHLSHGVYKGMHLPCRDLNIRIRIGVLYDCIYSPKPSGTTDKQTPLTAEPSLATTEISTTSLSTLPSSILTSATVEAPTVETTATEAPITRTRRRPKSCNLTEENDGDLDFLSSVSSAGNLQFLMACGTSSLLVYISSLTLTLV